MESSLLRKNTEAINHAFIIGYGLRKTASTLLCKLNRGSEFFCHICCNTSLILNANIDKKKKNKYGKNVKEDSKKSHFCPMPEMAEI